MNAYTALAVDKETAANIEEWGGTAVSQHRPLHVRARNSLRRQLNAALEELLGSDGPHAGTKEITKDGSSFFRVDNPEDFERGRRLLGWLRALGPATRRMIRAADWSRSRATVYVPLGAIFDRCPSPGRLERHIRKIMRRAAMILRAWDCRPSYRMLCTTLIAWQASGIQLRRPHKAAIRLVADVLDMRFAGPAWQPGRPWERIARHRLHRQMGPSPSGPAAIEEFGLTGSDDRAHLRNPHMLCSSPRGAIIVPLAPIGRIYGPLPLAPVGARTAVQVVVRCPSTGQRHHITVPPQFGLPLLDGESADARVHAALAWTFGLTPEQYTPGQET